MDDYEKQLEEWENKLKAEGLASIDVSVGIYVYIDSERKGGQRVLSLGIEGIPDDELACLAVYDEHDIESDISQQRALALTQALPRPIRILGERKLRDGGLNRSDAQTLRRLLSFFSWEKLNQRAGLSDSSKEGKHGNGQ